MDNKDDVFEIFKLHHSGQNKYSYFLLAAAGAAIGFALQKVDSCELSWWLLPVGVAIIFWGISFFMGCKQILWVQTAVYANYNLLCLNRGIHSKQPTDPKEYNIAIETTEKALDSNVKKAEFYAKWQFHALIWGAVLFIFWRVLELIHKSIT